MADSVLAMLSDLKDVVDGWEFESEQTKTRAFQELDEWINKMKDGIAKMTTAVVNDVVLDKLVKIESQLQVVPENKRKSEESDDESTSKKRSKCSDLIVLGLPWKTTETELREYFEQFGELLMAQVKKDLDSGLSKGFGFIRFADYDVQKKVIGKRHNISGRWCDVRIPLSRGEAHNSEFNRKIFVGRLTEDITTEDLRDYFSKFGEITDVFIPRPFRAFAFITFESEISQNICGDDHIVNGVSLHVSNAMPKSEMNMSRSFEPANNNFMGGYTTGGPIKPHGMAISHPPNYARHSPYYSSYAARRTPYNQHQQQQLPRRFD